MHIEVEKKKDSLFQNTVKYNELIDIVKNIGEKCVSLQEFNEKISLEWNNITTQCCIKSPVHIYKYYAIEKENPKYGKYIMLHIKSEIDESRMESEKQRVLLNITENENKIKEMLQDESYLGDMRVTEQMIKKYKSALTETKSVLIKNPHYILDNMDEAKQTLYEYLIDVLQNNDICGIQKKIMLDNEYTKYMSLMTGIEVVMPEEFKYI